MKVTRDPLPSQKSAPQAIKSALTTLYIPPADGKRYKGTIEEGSNLCRKSWQKKKPPVKREE
jgi:hypothetical protein